jgi:predicted transcriptional regulator
MRKTEIRVEKVDAFFERGRKRAKAADQREAIPFSRVVAFEDVEALLHVLTEQRVLLLRQVKGIRQSNTRVDGGGVWDYRLAAHVVGVISASR